MRKSGGEPMSCGYSPTPPAACAWSAHSPSKPTKTGSKPTATSIWTNCASRRKPNYAKPHEDRKSVVEGKGVSVRVDLGGSGILKKKNKLTTTTSEKLKVT